MDADQNWPVAPGAESLTPPLSTRDLRTFAGSAAYAGPLHNVVDYYVPRWVEALSSGAPRAGFNWAAAFFGANWCLWRKLYALALTIFVAELLTSLLLTLIFLQGFQLEPDVATVNTIGWLALLPVRALLGRYANTLYLSKAIETVATARHQIAHPEQQNEFLATRGGTSWLVLGIALAAQAFVMVGPTLPN